MSEGETPLIRAACPIVLGCIAFSFSLPSVEIECNLSNSKSSAIFPQSKLKFFISSALSLSSSLPPVKAHPRGPIVVPVKKYKLFSNIFYYESFLFDYENAGDGTVPMKIPSVLKNQPRQGMGRGLERGQSPLSTL